MTNFTNSRRDGLRECPGPCSHSRVTAIRFPYEFQCEGLADSPQAREVLGLRVLWLEVLGLKAPPGIVAQPLQPPSSEPAPQ